MAPAAAAAGPCVSLNFHVMNAVVARFRVYSGWELRLRFSYYFASYLANHCALWV